MLASFAIFGIALDARGVLSAAMVGAGVALYSRPRPPSAYERIAMEEGEAPIARSC